MAIGFTQIEGSLKNWRFEGVFGVENAVLLLHPNLPSHLDLVNVLDK